MSEDLKPQPKPHRWGGPSVWDAVIEDMRARNQFGVEKYGGPLEPYDGRDTLKDAYQEACDLTVYLKAQLMEGDRHANWFAAWRVCFMVLQEAERTGEWALSADQQEAIMKIFGRCG